MEFHKCSDLWNSINDLWNSINHLWNSINDLWNSINAYFRALRLASLTSDFFRFDSLTYFFRFRLFRFDSRFLTMRDIVHWKVWLRDKYLARFVLSVCICPSPHHPKGKAHAEAPLSAAFRPSRSGKTNNNFNNM